MAPLIRTAALTLVLLAGASSGWPLRQAGLHGQEVDASRLPVAAGQPGSNLEVFLVTAGPGDAIWERFSHNAIWIRDNDTGRNTAYNWGIFSFGQENFVIRLVRGRMLYSLYGLDMQRMAAEYVGANRRLVINPVDLDPGERLELYRTLQAMDNDQDRQYRYDYYRDNCSTRVRDALDAVLGGQIEERWTDELTEATYRWHTRRLLLTDQWAALGIDFVMGHSVDRPLSAWEEMFLPLPTRDYLERTNITRTDGSVRPLLGAPQVMSEADRPPVPSAPSGFPWGWLGLGSGLALALAGLARWGGSGSVAGRRGFALLGALWTSLLGLMGTVLLLMWPLTDHVYSYWNENVLQMHPGGFVVAFWLLAGALGYEWTRARKWSRWVTLVALAGLFLQVVPGFSQANADILALTILPYLAIAWGTDRLASEEA